MLRAGRDVRRACRDVKTGEVEEREVDAVVFAVGVTGMQKIVAANPALGARADFRRIMNLQGLDVVSTRLWLDRRVETQFPANVLAGFDDDMGSTYFNLNDLHVRPPPPQIAPILNCVAPYEPQMRKEEKFSVS